MSSSNDLTWPKWMEEHTHHYAPIIVLMQNIFVPSYNALLNNVLKYILNPKHE
jgi:hypothetical protein